jgi:hypothetical protein
METTLKTPLLCAASIAWYRQIANQSHIVLQDYERFPKYPWFNRIVITSDHGKEVISLPLDKDSRKGPYSQVKLSYATNWHHQLLNALKTSYRRSPFYEYYDIQIEQIVKSKHEYLFEFNLALLEWSLNALKLPLKFEVKSCQDFIEPIFKEEKVPYYQVFANNVGFVPNLSIFDLIFHEGIDAGMHLVKK